MSNRRLPRGVGRWKGTGDGIESVLEEGVLHGGCVTVRRDDVDGLQRDNFRGRDDSGGPIPERSSEVLCCLYPAIFILIPVGNIKSMLLQHLLFDSINKVAYKSKTSRNGAYLV
jgi:hypothetical protein